MCEMFPNLDKRADRMADACSLLLIPAMAAMLISLTQQWVTPFFVSCSATVVICILCWVFNRRATRNFTPRERYNWSVIRDPDSNIDDLA